MRPARVHARVPWMGVLLLLVLVWQAPRLMHLHHWLLVAGVHGVRGLHVR